MDNCCQDVIMNRYRYMQQQTADSAVAEEGSHMGGDDPVLHAVCSLHHSLQSRVKLIPQLLPSSSSFADIQVHSSRSQIAIFQQAVSTVHELALHPVGQAPSIAPVSAKIPFLSADLIRTF